MPALTKTLTTVKPVNKTDVITLLDAFGTLKNITSADEATLLMCPGIGEKKVHKLFQVLHQPFKKKGESSISNAGHI